MHAEDLEKAVRKMFKERILPLLVRKLITDEILDTSRLSEADYVLSEIKAHPEFIDTLKFFVSIDDNFIKSARDAIAANRPEVAIVLISTAIEHQLNMFYRETLDECNKLDEDTATRIIKSNSLHDKTGWLFKLTLQRDMDVELQKKILNLIELRNQIVHYKALPEAIEDPRSGSHNTIRIKIEELDFDEIFETLACLSNILEEALSRLRLGMDDYNHTQEAMQTLQEILQDY